MELLIRRLVFFSQLLFLPGFIQAQSSSDSAQVLQKCIDLPELQEFYPTDDKGVPIQVYIMQYPTSFQTDLELSKFGKNVSFMSRPEISETDISAYFMFRSFDLSQNTARINLNYFYNRDFDTKNFNMVSAVLELEKVGSLWSVSDIQLKKDKR